MYWLVENIYWGEHYDYTNNVIFTSTSESVLRSILPKCVDDYLKNKNYRFAGDENTTVLTNGVNEVTFYILKVVHEFPK